MTGVTPGAIVLYASFFVRCYPSDLTDEQWALVEPMVPVRPGGRPAIHPHRRIVEAILSVNPTGCSWRQLPHDSPPWDTVYWYFQRWNGGAPPTGSMMRCARRCAMAPVVIRWPAPASWMLSQSKALTPCPQPAVGSRRGQEGQWPQPSCRGRHPRSAGGGAGHRSHPARPRSTARAHPLYPDATSCQDDIDAPDLKASGGQPPGGSNPSASAFVPAQTLIS